MNPTQKMTPIKIGIMVFFGALVLVGFGIFAGIIPAPLSKDDQQKITGTVTIWGPFDRSVMNIPLEVLKAQFPDATINYVALPEASFQTSFVDALASGRAPDLVLLSQDSIIKNKERIFAIPYETLPARDFRNQYLDAGSIFLHNEGIVALPILVDPLVMYYNRTLFTNDFIVDIPQFWDQIVQIAPRLTKTNDAGAIRQAGISMGTFDNINHAKEIFLALMLQAGSPLVMYRPDGESFQSVFSFTTPVGAASLISGEFFTRFGRNTDPLYSWNNALPNSRDAFLANQLGIYLGKGSELPQLRRLNPNLNYDIALFPQDRNALRTTTFADVYGVAITRQSQNLAAAVPVMYALAGQEFLNALTLNVDFVPARRDTINTNTNDPELAVLYQSAIIAQSWLDPDGRQSRDAIRDFIRGLERGIQGGESPVEQLNTRINQIISSYEQ